MVSLRKLIGLFAILILSISLAGIATADTQPADEDKPLEEVLVTAQKKEQGLRDVPSSVATLSDEKLDVITSAGQDIRLLSSRVPSLHVESSFGRTLPRFYIRGLGNTDFDLNASQPVSVVYDGVVLENPILKGYPIFDMERIEVLRGPQGTLFGRNTPAGIVKFESRKPAFDPDGYARYSFGVYNTMQFEGAYGGPLVDGKLAARGAFLYQGRSDWVDNTFTGEEDALGGYSDFAGRLQLLYTPSETFTALLNVHMRDLDGTARLFRGNMIVPGTNEIVDGFERDEIGVDGGNEQEVKEKGGVLTMDLELNETLTLTSITGYESGEIYSRGDIDGDIAANVPFSSESADGIPDLTQITQEIRLSSNYSGKLNFQAGLFIFDEDLDIDTFNYVTSADGLTDGPQSGYAHQTQETTAMALFGTLEYDLTEDFKVSGGLRYSDETKDFMAERTEEVWPGQGLIDPIEMSRDSDFISWDLNGMYTVNEDVNVYGRVARGFRAPSFQGRLLFADAAADDKVTVGETEKITSYEVGTKARLTRTARANFSVFHYVMNDQQLTAVGGDANVTRLINAKETTGTGFELELEWLPTSQVFCTVGTSYNKTEINDPDLAVAPGFPATVLDGLNQAGNAYIDGNSLPNAPEWVFNATMRAAMPAGDDGEVFLFTDWAYRSEVNFFLYESEEFKQDSLVEGGLRIGYTTYDRKYEVAAFARNITDNLSRTGGIDFNNLTGFVNEPRTFGVEVRYGF